VRNNRLEGFRASVSLNSRVLMTLPNRFSIARTIAKACKVDGMLVMVRISSSVVPSDGSRSG
jgi:hypothetical protein